MYNLKIKIMDKIKYFIGPMSKNIVDAIVEFSATTGNIIGLIPSRRQIEWDGGYVNNWTTEEFSKYVTTLDLKSMPACWFLDGINPVTKAVCKEAFSNISHDISNDKSDIISNVYFSVLGVFGLYILIKLLEKKE